MVTKMIAQDCKIVMGVDVSTTKHNVCVVDAVDGHVLHEDAIKPPQVRAYQRLLARMPGCQVTVVYEAGPDGYTLFDLASTLGSRGVVVAPQKHVGYKTDARDAQHIARDYLAGRVKLVRAPEFSKRVERQVLRTRDQFMKERSQTMNRLKSLRRMHGLSAPGLRTLEYDKTGLLDIVQNALWDVVRFLTQKIEELEETLKRIIKDNADYKALSRALLKLPGVGQVTMWQVLLNVADLNAFDTAERFASYTGLCPGLYNTGITQRHGRITRRGPGALRGALLQGAWACVRCDPGERAFFQDLSKRRGKKKAIVAVARRLAEKIWRAARAQRKTAPLVQGAAGPACP